MVLANSKKTILLNKMKEIHEKHKQMKLSKKKRFMISVAPTILSIGCILLARQLLPNILFLQNWTLVLPTVSIVAIIYAITMNQIETIEENDLNNDRFYDELFHFYKTESPTQILLLGIHKETKVREWLAVKLDGTVNYYQAASLENKDFIQLENGEEYWIDTAPVGQSWLSPLYISRIIRYFCTYEYTSNEYTAFILNEAEYLSINFKQSMMNELDKYSHN